MKILDGRELAGFVKERQAQNNKALRFAPKNSGDNRGRRPKLMILRDNDDTVIEKYVGLKKRYGEDIGVEVEDFCAGSRGELAEKIREANADTGVDAIIVQLPLRESAASGEPGLEEILGMIAPEKDVDGLSHRGKFDSATATAINWLLTGYDIPLKGKKIAVVGRGRLVGAPLAKMWQDSGLDVTVLHRGDDLMDLVNYDVIVTATGVPGLIRPEMVRSGAVVVDAGTASEKGIILGDVDDSLRERGDLGAVTPKVGGVGPLTVAVLFENVLRASATHN